MYKLGVFDSGVGGLTVLKALMGKFSNTEFVYVGDTAHLPYGNKSAQVVTSYAREIIRFLETQNVDAIVIACNTASALAYPALKKEIKTPLFEMIEPALSKAAALTKTNRVGVIGTRATIASGAYPLTAKKQAPQLMITSVACPLFVPLVEEGMLTHAITRAVAELYLAPLKGKIDTLILGCTHYPLIAPIIGQVLGKGVQLVSSAEAAAQVVHTTLSRPKVEPMLKSSHVELYATDDPARLTEFAIRGVHLPVGETHLLHLSGL